MTPTDGWIGHIIFIAALVGAIVLVTIRTRRLVNFLRLGSADNRFDDPLGAAQDGRPSTSSCNGACSITAWPELFTC